MRTKRFNYYKKLINIYMKSIVMRKIYVLALVIPLLSSCLDDGNEDKSEVGSDVQIEMYEEVSADPNALLLLSMTEQVFSCSNYQIAATTQITEDAIIIDYTGIVVPNGCITSQGPAFSKDLFAVEEGTYRLELRVDDELNEGTLEVNDSLFAITMTSSPSVDILTDTLLRIPDGLYWGSIAYYDQADVDLVDSFVDSLNQMPIEMSTLKDGNYGYFELENQQIEVTPPDGGYARGIYFKYIGDDEAEVRNTIIDYALTYPDKLVIRFANYKGEVISIYNK
jgi:hypothetical protein